MEAMITLAAIGLIALTMALLFVVEPFVELLWELLVAIAQTVLEQGRER